MPEVKLPDPDPIKDLNNEMSKRKTQRTRILDLLKGDDPVYTYDLERIAYNYTGRVSELRKDGHVISAVYVKPSVYRYIYGGKRDDN